MSDKEPGQLAYELMFNASQFFEPWGMLPSGDKFRWNAMETTIRADQREKDAVICDELGELSKTLTTDSAWQHGECAAAIRKGE